MRVRGIVMTLCLGCLGMVGAVGVGHAQIGGVTVPVTNTTTTTTTTTTTNNSAAAGGGGAGTNSLLPDTPTLGLSVGTPFSALTPFAPGSTATSTGTLVVVSPGTWTLTATDGSSGTTQPGHLKRGVTCTAGTAYLAQALSVSVSATVGTATSSGAKQLSGSAQVLATGPTTLQTTLSTAFSQPIGPTEVLQQGCAYGLTVTFTLS